MSLEGSLIMITGAARSGKSYFAEQMAGSLGTKVTYIATCIPLGMEMEKRIALHKIRRPDNWLTIEEPFDPVMAIKQNDGIGKVFLLDCLTLLISNWIFECLPEKREEIVINRIEQLAKASREALATVIIVTNEVGWGIVPDNPLSRDYRDLVGRANQIVGVHANEVYISIAGIPIELKALKKELAKPAIRY